MSDGFRHSLASLALGALDPAEERRVREHLRDCPECSAEYAELAGTVRILAAAGPDVTSDPVAPPTRVLNGLLTAVAQQRRAERRRRWALGAAAAAIGAVIAGTGTVLLVDGDEPAPPAAAQTPAPSAQLSGAAGGVALQVDLWTRAWGTAVHGVVSGVPAGATCSLVAVGLDGSREVAATWAVPQSGYDPGTGKLGFDGAVGLRPHQVSHYEVVTTTGDVLVTARA